MKRHTNLYQQIISLDNLQLADAKACKGKGWQYGVRIHQRNQEDNLMSLHKQLNAGTYRTSAYTIFKIYEPKEREIYRLPYYPDRIVHHAVMNVLEPLFVAVFTADTFSCIKGRGIHGAANAVKKALRDQPGTQYCIKLDIKKFYPSIDHAVLKALLRRKFKDVQLLALLDEVIDSAPGLPIGNYLSQYLANFYLTWFDHWLKEQMQVKYYFRYADDLVILSHSKEHLHSLFISIRQYLNEKLKLEVKSNWQIFPVEARGVDFVGYVFYHTHTRLRKTIKQNFARMLAKNPNPQSIASYKGWTDHCNAKHLTKTLLHEFLFTDEYKANRDGFHRRQNKTQPDTERANHCTQVQNRTIQISGQRQRQTTGVANRMEEQSAYSFFRISNADGDDTTCKQRTLPVHHNN
ncbi:MAG: reverse transcriptase domain-containing protein [Bacteroidota bacterium]